MICAKSDKDSFGIDSTKNFVSKALYNAGKRITATCKLQTNPDEFYALVHKRDTDKNLDESRIQKYKLIKSEKGDEFEIKFIKQIGAVFKDQGVNAEGLAVIESEDDNDEYKVFLGKFFV